MKHVLFQPRDGLGSVLCRFAMLLETFPDKKIIIDVEWWNYYNRKNVGVDEEKMVVDFNYNKFISEFRLHPRVIFSPSIISTIDKKDIYELPRGYYGPKINSIVRASNQNQIPELSASNLMILPRKDPIVEIKNCIGVHARLGNGEKNGDGKEIPRMVITPNLFIKNMRKFKGDFYVCSDTKDFIDLCKEEFGDRVKTQDREYSARGAGPGHLRKMRETPTDPVLLLKEALTEILLLSKCEYLICNNSAFTLLARSTIPKENIIKINPNMKI
jgi:hypothetical protein